MKSIFKRLNLDFFCIIFFLSFLFAGAFHNEISCLLSILLSVAVFLYAKKEGRIYLRFDFTGITLCVIVSFYLISSLWAVDTGMAFLGFIKYLPLLLFYIMLTNKPEAKGNMLRLLPYFAAGITVLSALLMQVPFLKEQFSVAGRFAGTFQYPNTYAVFLLLCELLLLSGKNLKFRDLIIALILILGILYTGSRTVFILAAVANLVILFFIENRKIRIALFGVGILVVAGTLGVALLGESRILSRFLSISLQESTFVGRLLYFRDALPEILKHPFGLGYDGYYYIQQTIQTGVYSIRNIHNDFLQLLLDVGWIPAGLLIAVIVRAFINKKIPVTQKIILAVLVIHSCWDFNFQFVAMVFLLLLLVDAGEGRRVPISSKSVVAAGTGFCALLCCYFGIVSGAYHLGGYDVVDALYPDHTDNTVYLLQRAETAESMDRIADRILSKNRYVAIAYSAKARAAYSRGDFGTAIKYKHLVFQYAPFGYEDYEEYCYMLINGIALYSQANDEESIAICKEELIKTYDAVLQFPQKLSPLGTMIKDQPNTEFPAEIAEYVARLKGEK